MGQKTNPIGNRLGFIRGWDSNWYGGKDYTDKLVEDDKHVPDGSFAQGKRVQHHH